MVYSDHSMQLSAYRDGLNSFARCANVFVCLEKGKPLIDFHIHNEKELERVFDNDFKEALKNAESLIGERSINFIAKQVIIEMVFQLGIGGVGKFKKMWLALDSEDYGEASFQMMDSLWAKQTPNRAEKLSQKMRSAKTQEASCG